MQEKESKYLHKIPAILKIQQNGKYKQGRILDAIVPGCFGYIFDLKENKFEQIWGTQEILGYKTEEFQPEFYHEKIHPDDFDSFTSHQKEIFEHLLKQEDQQILNWTSTILFRVLREDNSYAHILKTMTLLESQNNTILKTVNWCNDVTDMKLEDNVASQFSVLDSPNKPKKIRLTSIPHQIIENLTPRELEIIKHTKVGLTTKEIAKVLIISEYTVSKHKSNIMAKTHCKSMGEVLFKLNI